MFLKPTASSHLEVIKFNGLFHHIGIVLPTFAKGFGGQATPSLYQVSVDKLGGALVAMQLYIINKKNKKKDRLKPVLTMSPLLLFIPQTNKGE
jgi:hypothetical protein